MFYHNLSLPHCCQTLIFRVRLPFSNSFIRFMNIITQKILRLIGPQELKIQALTLILNLEVNFRLSYGKFKLLLRRNHGLD